MYRCSDWISDCLFCLYFYKPTTSSIHISQAHIDLAIYHNNEKVHNNNDPMKNDDRLKQGRPKTDSKIYLFVILDDMNSPNKTKY